MSSALRHVSQIEPHVRFLRLITEEYLFVTDASMNEFLSVNTTSGSGLNTVVISATEPVSEPTSAYSLVRDLGRRVTVVSDAAGNLVKQVWIQVQGVSGSGSEGVEDSAPEYGTFWISTFNVDGVSVQWARLG